MKIKLKRDKIPSITKHGELVGVYIKNKKFGEILLIELPPKKADKLIKYWNKL